MNKSIVPKLSNDITIHPMNKNDFFIHQTIFDHRIKISSELNEFVKLIDNKKSLTEIVTQYNFKYNTSLTIEFAYDFLYSKLAKYGIIESNEVKVLISTKPNYIKLNFIVINEKIVGLFTKKLNFLFSPKILKLTLLASIIVIAISFYNLNSVIFNSTLPKSDWLFLFIISFIGVTFHEFGHASAAHHYGAKHGGIGGGFYLFMPVYFADVTDIWKLPKNQRIVVNLAGMYFELLYVAFLIIIGLLLNIQQLIIISCIYSISIIHSLNPFARSDGYWVLSDIIEKPNLMKHGYNKIKEVFKPQIKWKKIDFFVFFYGIISYFFLILFVYFVVIKNPNSILYFPQNVYKFIRNIFTTNVEFSLVELGKLIIPMLFFYLLFGFIKPIIKKIFNKK